MRLEDPSKDPSAPSPGTEAPDHRAASWRHKLHEIIFEADTFAGKTFDVLLLLAILISVGAVVLDSVKEVRLEWGRTLLRIEWAFTALFAVEYLLRLLCVRRPLRYATSFFGVVDLLAILPTFFGLVLTGSQSLLVVRTLRLIRVFRIFKLGHHVRETQALLHALKETRTKITVFLVVVLTLVLILGSTMHLIEGGNPESGFTSIPRSLYWAVVTMTTVGYGDIAPRTIAGQTVAALAMILGYTIIVVPTGIFSVEVIKAYKGEVTTRACPSCSREGHDGDAVHCKYCGERL